MPAFTLSETALLKNYLEKKLWLQNGEFYCYRKRTYWWQFRLLQRRGLCCKRLEKLFLTGRAVQRQFIRLFYNYEFLFSSMVLWLWRRLLHPTVLV
jgi:hypothetical protein